MHCFMALLDRVGASCRSVPVGIPDRCPFLEIFMLFDGSMAAGFRVFPHGTYLEGDGYLPA